MSQASSSSKLMVVCLVGLLAVMMISEVKAAPRERPDGQVQDTPSSKKPRGSEMVSLLLDHKLPSGHKSAIHDHSISPWTYNTTYDENMYPPTLSDAKCLLIGCRNEHGKEDMSLLSKPIRQEVLVLKRVNDDGKKYHFRLERRVISVGCTCIRPVVQYEQ